MRFPVALGALLLLVPLAAAHIPDDSGLLAQGGSYSATFDEAGEYAYHCHPHPYMTGRIVVSSDAPETSGPVQVRMRDFAFEPANLTIRPDTVVVWTNEDEFPHDIRFERPNATHAHADGESHGNATDHAPNASHAADAPHDDGAGHDDAAPHTDAAPHAEGGVLGGHGDGHAHHTPGPGVAAALVALAALALTRRR